MSTFWISKYALTEGVFSIDLNEPEPDQPSLISSNGTVDGRWHMYHGEGREWHRTEDAAKTRAEDMRVAKIVSLKKQISKLEKLTFN